MDIMRTLIIFLLITLSSIAFSADWNKINGLYAVTPENYLDSPKNELKDTHYRFQLTGKSAKNLYAAIKVTPVKDECTNAQAKNIGNMQCLYFKESSSYECHFSINIAEQKIEYGVAC